MNAGRGSGILEWLVNSNTTGNKDRCSFALHFLAFVHTMGISYQKHATDVGLVHPKSLTASIAVEKISSYGITVVSC